MKFFTKILLSVSTALCLFSFAAMAMEHDGEFSKHPSRGKASDVNRQKGNRAQRRAYLKEAGKVEAGVQKELDEGVTVPGGSTLLPELSPTCITVSTEDEVPGRNTWSTVTTRLFEQLQDALFMTRDLQVMGNGHPISIQPMTRVLGIPPERITFPNSVTMLRDIPAPAEISDGNLLKAIIGQGRSSPELGFYGIYPTRVGLYGIIPEGRWSIAIGIPRTLIINDSLQFGNEATIHLVETVARGNNLQAQLVDSAESPFLISRISMRGGARYQLVSSTGTTDARAYVRFMDASRQLVDSRFNDLALSFLRSLHADSRAIHQGAVKSSVQ